MPVATEEIKKTYNLIDKMEHSLNAEIITCYQLCQKDKEEFTEYKTKATKHKDGRI